MCSPVTACFFAACPTAAGIAIVDAWWHASGGDGGKGNEQKAFQKLLNRQPELFIGTAAAAARYGGRAAEYAAAATPAAATAPAPANAANRTTSVSTTLLLSGGLRGNFAQISTPYMFETRV